MNVACPICKSISGFIKICSIYYNSERNEISEYPTEKYLCIACNSVITNNDIKKGK